MLRCISKTFDFFELFDRVQGMQRTRDLRDLALVDRKACGAVGNASRQDAARAREERQRRKRRPAIPATFTLALSRVSVDKNGPLRPPRQRPPRPAQGAPRPPRRPGPGDPFAKCGVGARGRRGGGILHRGHQFVVSGGGRGRGTCEGGCTFIMRSSVLSTMSSMMKYSNGDDTTTRQILYLKLFLRFGM
jgi:hypothetical protein